MAKPKHPLFSFGAIGRLGKALTFLRRRHTDIVEKTPIPEDVKSLGQLSWRHMYQKAIALWHALSAAEKQEWESLARPKHMTGFAWFISQALKPNPGLYLPLQGGTMSGNIDMAKNRLLKLPAPVDSQEADTLITRIAAIATHTADLDAHTYNFFEQMLVGRYYNQVLTYANAPSSALVANMLLAVPFIVARLSTWDRIAVHIFTLDAGKKLRMGIYNDDGSIYPGSLILDAGEVDVGTTGTKAITINRQLAKGLYWLALVTDGVPNILYNHYFLNILGAAVPYRASGLYVKAFAYAPLPDPFGPPPSFQGLSREIMLRLASLD